MKKIKAWCLNTNGAATAWEVMNEACSEEVPIIAMQEICMKKEEAEAFATRAFSLGYVTYFGHGEQSPKDGKMRGGVCLMVDKRLRSREYSTICGKGGQCIMVYVQDMVMASCYLAHHEERMHHCEKIVANIQAIGGRTAWIIGGDFNDEPHENPLLTTLETLAARAVTVDDAEERMPTRFKGSRCIDYWITNKKVGITEPCLLEESYSDHRLLQITIDDQHGKHCGYAENRALRCAGELRHNKVEGNVPRRMGKADKAQMPDAANTKKAGRLLDGNLYHTGDCLQEMLQNGIG